jgi:hypothetical protein
MVHPKPLLKHYQQRLITSYARSVKEPLHKTVINNGSYIWIRCLFKLFVSVVVVNQC